MFKLLLKKLLTAIIFSIFAVSIVGNLNDAYAGLLACRPGTFSIGIQCIACSPGTAQPGFNQPFCIPCQGGTFAANAGQVFCNQCPAGQTSNPGATMCVADTSIIGGEIIPIETTSLLLANTQSFSWMIPVLLSGIGIGLFVVSRKSE